MSGRKTARITRDRLGDQPLTENLALNTEDAAAVIGVTPSVLTYWRHAGTGPAYVRTAPTKQSRVLYLTDDLRAWLESCRENVDCARGRQTDAATRSTGTVQA